MSSWIITSCVIASLLMTSCTGSEEELEDIEIELASDNPSLEPPPDREDGEVVQRTKTLSTIVNSDDLDLDHISDSEDNCPTLFNPDQEDTDDDGVGEACD